MRRDPLEAKARVGLLGIERRTVDLEALPLASQPGFAQRLDGEVFDKTVTLVKNERDLLPFGAPRVFPRGLSFFRTTGAEPDIFATSAELERRAATLGRIRLTPRTSPQRVLRPRRLPSRGRRGRARGKLRPHAIASRRW